MRLAATAVAAVLLIATAAVGSVAAKIRGYSLPELDEDIQPWPCVGLDTPPYNVIDKFGPNGEIELRRYRAGVWVTVPVDSHDFKFMTEDAYERLSRYFDGDNFARTVVPKTTPMRIKFNLWAPHAQRFASFYVSQKTPPAPKEPAFLEEVDETYVFATPYNNTRDFRLLCKDVADLLVDLVIADEPMNGTCDGDGIILNLYTYPKNIFGNIPSNEILVMRKQETYKPSSNTGGVYRTNLRTDIPVT